MEHFKVTPFNVEYYTIKQATDQLLTKHVEGDHSIVDDLSALDSRLGQLYASTSLNTAGRIAFLHHLLTLWGGEVIFRKLDITGWLTSVEKFVSIDYNKE